MPSVKKLGMWAVFFIVIGILWKGLNLNMREVQSNLIDKPVPKFNAKTVIPLDHQVNQRIFLHHVAVLNVFASWCGYCRSEHPLWMDLALKKKIHLIGIDYMDHKGKVRRWLARNGNPYLMVLFDPNGRLGVRLGVCAVPATFIVDKTGVIRYKYSGPVSRAVWQRELLPVIRKLEAK